MAEETANQDEKTAEPTSVLVALSAFLETRPPGKQVSLSDVAKHLQANGSLLTIPPIQLHCDSQHCGGVRIFDPSSDSHRFYDSNWTQVFLNYSCRHCKGTRKAFALMIHIQRPNKPSEAIKFGEWPIFAPHVPSRVLSMVGKDQESFLKGRRAESLGMGIAAFAYYRRVVENQKARLIDQIATVARRIKADPAIIKLLERSK